jgi:hypothetical protein
MQQRVIGYDLARALALFGMTIATVLVTLTITDTQLITFNRNASCLTSLQFQL